MPRLRSYLHSRWIKTLSKPSCRVEQSVIAPSAIPHVKDKPHVTMLFQHVFFVLLMVALKELCFGFQRLPKKQTMLLIHLRSSASTNDDTMVPLNKASITRVCRNCKQQYNNNDIPNANSQESGCQFHPGIYSGRLNRINDVDTSDLEYFWSCCGNYDLTSKGCILSSKHVSYDDISYTRYSVLTGKEITY